MIEIKLIIGGARSGKSALAERYAKSSNMPVTYIATAQAFDCEMQQRINQHQSERPNHWQLIESPLQLAKAIELAISNASNEQANDNDGICILVDCLTLWLSNCLCKPNTDLVNNVESNPEGNLIYWEEEKLALLSLLASIQKKIHSKTTIELILVSNEVGHGIVPMGELSRQFVDQAGWLHQAIATIADNVDFVMAGLPLALKSSEKSKL